MNKLDSVVIAGGGLAGATAAFALRERGFTGRVVLVSEEQAPPYERPPLSKGYLRGESTLEQAQVRPLADYEAQDIELLRGRRAVTLDPAIRQLNLDDGTNLTYNALLIATGAAPRHLGSTRADLAGVQYLRNAEDADAIRTAADGAKAIAVIGGGWIGSEVAASLRQLGRSVTIVSDTPRPLERVLGPEVAEVYRALHAEHGVELVHGLVSAVDGSERVEGVRLADGRRIAADLVVVGIGAIPRIKLATRGGLETIEGGIAVDEYLRSSVPSIYAAGDVAAAWHPASGATCGSSTGTTPSSRGRPPRPTSWAPTSPTRARRTSTPISSTSAWSTAASRRNGARSWYAGISPGASSMPSGWPMTASWRQ